MLLNIFLMRRIKKILMSIDELIDLKLDQTSWLK